jgi:hypothetical protein
MRLMFVFVTLCLALTVLAQGTPSGGNAGTGAGPTAPDGGAPAPHKSGHPMKPYGGPAPATPPPAR